MAKKPQAEIELQYSNQAVFKRSDNFRSIYLNATQFGFTRWDFQMILGQVEVSKDPEHQIGSETAVITMTPQYAKALLDDFAKVLATYEAQYGQIVVEADITKEVSKKKAT